MQKKNSKESYLEKGARLDIRAAALEALQDGEGRSHLFQAFIYYLDPEVRFA